MTGQRTLLGLRVKVKGFQIHGSGTHTVIDMNDKVVRILITTSSASSSLATRLPLKVSPWIVIQLSSHPRIRLYVKHTRPSSSVNAIAGVPVF